MRKVGEVQLGTAILAICLLPVSAGVAQDASPGAAPLAHAVDESNWCAEHRESIASRRATLIAQEPGLKAEMATAFDRLETDVDTVGDPIFKQRMAAMRSAKDDLTHWGEFVHLFDDAKDRLPILGRGITAWDIDAFSSLYERMAKHEQLSYQISEDESLYTPSCTDPPHGPSAKAIVDALKTSGVKDPDVLLYIDLAGKFRTSSTWALAVVRERTPLRPDWEEEGPLVVCFLKDRSPACLDNAGNPQAINEDDERIPYVLFDARIVQASPDGQSPRLLVKTCTEPSGDGDCGIATSLYTYNKAMDHFESLFQNVTEHNTNARTRFVESGPIRSYIIVDYPTENAPYTYWVEVHRPQAGGKYSQILKYRGKTEYNDGNALAVADSEMPEILRRLGMWKSGDPLPAPPTLPDGCTTVFMKKGVEWCK